MGAIGILLFTRSFLNENDLDTPRPDHSATKVGQGEI